MEQFQRGLILLTQVVIQIQIQILIPKFNASITMVEQKFVEQYSKHPYPLTEVQYLNSLKNLFWPPFGLN